MGLYGSITGSVDKSASGTPSWTKSDLVIPVTGTFQFASGSMNTHDAAGHLSHVLAVKDEDMIVQLLPTSSLGGAGGSGDVTMASNTTTDNVIVTTDGTGAKAIQQANTTLTTGGQTLSINANNKYLVFGASEFSLWSGTDGNQYIWGRAGKLNITSSGGEIALTGAVHVEMVDNHAEGFVVKQGSTDYMKFVTTNGQEYISTGKEVVLSEGASLADSKEIKFASNPSAKTPKIWAESKTLVISGSGAAGNSDAAVAISGSEVGIRGDLDIQGGLFVSSSAAQSSGLVSKIYGRGHNHAGGSDELIWRAYARTGTALDHQLQITGAISVSASANQTNKIISGRQPVGPLELAGLVEAGQGRTADYLNANHDLHVLVFDASSGSQDGTKPYYGTVMALPTASLHSEGGGGGAGIAFDGSTANGVATYKSATTASVESSFTFDGATNTLSVTGTFNHTGTLNLSGALSITSTDESTPMLIMNDLEASAIIGRAQIGSDLAAGVDDYAMFSHRDFANTSNFALRQTAPSPYGGRTDINSPDSVTFRIGSATKAALASNGYLGVGHNYVTPIFVLDVSGSTRLGTDTSHTHEITGSLAITGTVHVEMVDNHSEGFVVKQGSTDYIKCVTTNGQEYISTGKEVVLGSGASLADGKEFKFASNPSSGTPELKAESSAGLVISGSQNSTAIALSGSTHVAMPDNSAAGFVVKEGSTEYLKCITTNGQEYITFGKQGSFIQGASISEGQTFAFGDDPSNPDAKINTEESSGMLHVSGAANGLVLSGSKVHLPNSELQFAGTAKILDSGGHSRIQFTDAGQLIFNDPAGGAEVSVGDGGAAVAGYLLVGGATSNFGNTHILSVSSSAQVASISGSHISTAGFHGHTGSYVQAASYGTGSTQNDLRFAMDGLCMGHVTCLKVGKANGSHMPNTTSAQIGALVGLDANQAWTLTSCTGSTSEHLLGVSLGIGTPMTGFVRYSDHEIDYPSGRGIMTRGTVRVNDALVMGLYDSTVNGSPIGKPLFISQHAGKYSLSPPSASAQTIRIVGHVVGYTLRSHYIIEFNPDPTWLEMA